MPELQIVDDPERVEAAFRDADQRDFPDWNSHPLSGQFSRNLYAAINREKPRHKLCAFCVVDSDKPVLMVPATYRGGTVSMFGLPMALAAQRGLGAKRRKRVFAMAFEHLAAVDLAASPDVALINGCFGSNPQTAADLACIDRLAAPQSHIHAVIDTTQGEKAVHRDVRASYRSLINWGRTQLQMRYVNAKNPDRALFDQMPAFHTHISGAGAHGNEYWEVYWNEIVAGRGEASLGFLGGGTLAAGTAVIDAGGVSYYASGVYDREKFDKPLAHYPVYDSILRAGQRGAILYDLGEVFPADTTDDKEVQIGFFKKGFTGAFRLRTSWSVPLSS